MSSGGDGRVIGHLTNDLKISEGPKHPHRSRDVKVPVKIDDRRGWRTMRVAYEGSGERMNSVTYSRGHQQHSFILILSLSLNPQNPKPHNPNSIRIPFP